MRWDRGRRRQPSQRNRSTAYLSPPTPRPTEDHMDWLTNPEIWVALVTLTVLEIVLGIDNVIFISILAGRLPE